MADKAPSPPSGQTTSFKLFLTFWAFTENLLFSGLRAGWPSLVIILKQEGVYRNLCEADLGLNDNGTGQGRTQAESQWYNSGRHGNGSSIPFSGSYSNIGIVPNNGSHDNNNSYTSLLLPLHVSLHANSSGANHPGTFTDTGAASDPTCDAQDQMFNKCFATATATMALSALLYGHLNYKYGIRAPRLISVVAFCLGAVCIAFISPDSSWLVFPGLLLVSSGGMALYITNNQISYMFSTGSAAIVGLLCRALEASSFVMTVIKLLYEHGVSLKASYLVLACLYLLTVVSTFCFLPRHFVTDTKHGASQPTADDQKASQPAEKFESEKLCQNFNDKNKELQIDIYEYKDIANNCRGPQDSEMSNKDDQNGHMLSLTSQNEAECDVTFPDMRRHQSEVTLCQSLLSPTFILYLFWASVVQIVLAMCLGTFNPWIEFVTGNNKSEVSRYTDVLFYSMLASPVLAMAAGVGMDVLKRVNSTDKRVITRRTLLTSSVSLGATSLLAIVVCAFIMTSSRDLVVTTCIALVLFRTGLYSCGTAFLRLMYPTHLFGILCGVMSVISGSTCFVQYPLFIWVQREGNAWLHVFGFLGLLGVVSLAQPCFLLYKSRRIRVGGEESDIAL